MLEVHRLRHVLGRSKPSSISVYCVGEYLKKESTTQVHEQLYLVVDRHHLGMELVVIALVVFLYIRTNGVATHIVVEEGVGRNIVG